MKYTRKQISEAIKYWQAKLKQLDESKSVLFDELKLKYGHEIVFSDKFDFKMQEFNAYDIYDIINRIIFDNKLDKIPVYCWSYNQICIELKYRKTKNFPSNNFYGVHSVILENDPDTVTQNSKLNMHDSIIMLNMDRMTKKANFAFTVACLCHEMIHYYDRLFGEYEELLKYECIHKIKINTHSTPTFKKFKDRALTMYLDVIDSGQGLDFDIVNKNAAELALSALDESATDNITDHISEIKGETGYCINDFD